MKNYFQYSVATILSLGCLTQLQAHAQDRRESEPRPSEKISIYAPANAPVVNENWASSGAMIQQPQSSVSVQAAPQQQTQQQPPPPPQRVAETVVDHAYSCTNLSGRPFELIHAINTDGAQVAFNSIDLHIFKSKNGREMGYAIETKYENEEITLDQMSIPQQISKNDAETEEIQAANDQLMRDYNSRMNTYQLAMSRIQKMRDYNQALEQSLNDQTHQTPPPIPPFQMIIQNEDQKDQKKDSKKNKDVKEVAPVDNGPYFYVIPQEPVRPYQPVLAPLPKLVQISTSISYGTERGHITSSFNMTLQGQSVASMQCRKTDHNVRENVVRGADVASYGGGTVRKREVRYNQGHQEQWCDSEDLEGRLRIDSLGGNLNVRCRKIKPSQDVIEKYYE